METDQSQETRELPPHIEALEARIELDDSNIKAWVGLFGEASIFDHDYMRSVYDRFLSIYPTCISKWIEYVEKEIKYLELAKKKGSIDDTSHLDKIFNKCLKSLPSTRLWKLYLDYLKDKVPAIDREVMSKAYKYSLAHVGLNIDSGSIWKDYLAFIKAEKSESSYEETHVLDQLRKTYQQAVAIPHDQLESLWREYDLFENGLNKLTAKKILGDKSGMYLTARSHYKELKSLHDQLDRDMVFEEIASRHDQYQLNQWIKILDLEKKNSLKLDQGDWIQRILATYKLAVCYLPRSSYLWVDMFQFAKTHESEEAGISWLKQAISYWNLGILPIFALAEAYECMNEYEKARNAYETLLDNQALHIEQFEGKVKRVQDGSMDKDSITIEPGLESKLEARLARLLDEHCLTHIQLMRFARRTDGLDAARHYFKKARDSRFCRHQVFVASAQMEYFVGKDPSIALKIFELGMRKFSDEIAFVREYMKHLLWQMDDSNAGALFEKALQTFGPDQARCLYDMLIDYEKEYGLLNPLKRICTRKTEQFPEENGWKSLVQRTDFMNMHVTKMPKSDDKQSRSDKKKDAIPPCLQELLDTLPLPGEYNGPIINPLELFSAIDRLNSSHAKRLKVQH